MTVSIASGIYTVVPIMALGYQAAQDSATVMHEIIGRSDPDVTMRPAKLRKGTLDLLFADQAAAGYCVTAHSKAAAFEYTNTELPATNMRYVLDTNGVSQEIDVETGRWLVHVSYREVRPL